MKPLVTALVDTYNHERYIEQALASVLEQGLSASELEIVVVDDGSTDGTPEIIQKFLPRVKYLRKKNGGQAYAFNAAFPEVSGQIVAILDGDDWWAKGKLPAVIAELEQNPEISAVSHAYYRFYEATNKLIIVVGPPETILVNLATPEAARAAQSERLGYSASDAATSTRDQGRRISQVHFSSGDLSLAEYRMLTWGKIAHSHCGSYRVSCQD